MGVGHSLRALIKKIDRASRSLKRAENADSLHNFRVNVRRLRTLLRAFSEAVPVPRNLMRELRKLAQCTNDTRDLQVAAQILRDMGSSRGVSPSKAALSRSRRYHKSALTQIDALRSWIPREWARLHVELLEHVPDQPWQPADNAYRQATGQQVEMRFTSLLEHLLSLRSLDQLDSLHSARILTKELRYLLEPFSETEPELAAPIRELTQLQDKLGLIHDLMLLRQRVRCEALQRQALQLTSCFDSGRVQAHAFAAQLEEDIALYRRLQQMAKRRFTALTKSALGDNAKPLVDTLRSPCASLIRSHRAA